MRVGTEKKIEACMAKHTHNTFHGFRTFQNFRQAVSIRLKDQEVATCGRYLDNRRIFRIFAFGNQSLWSSVQ